MLAAPTLPALPAWPLPSTALVLTAADTEFELADEQHEEDEDEQTDTSVVWRLMLHGVHWELLDELEAAAVQGADIDVDGLANCCW